MGVFVVSLFSMIIGGFYLFDFNRSSSSRGVPVFARVLGGIFFVVGALMALLVGLTWLLGLIVPAHPA